MLVERKVWKGAIVPKPRHGIPAFGGGETLDRRLIRTNAGVVVADGDVVERLRVRVLWRDDLLTIAALQLCN